MRRAKPSKGRHQHHALRGIRLCCQNPGFLCMADDAQTITQPLHRGTGNKNGAFECVMAFAQQLVGDGRQQPIARRNRRLTGIEQRETPRAIGGFHHARCEATLTDGGRLLVTRHTANGDGGTKQSGFRRAEIPRAIAHFRQDGFRDAKQPQQIRIPNATADIEQHGARGIGGIGRMHAPAREAPQQKAIHRAESKRTAFRRRPRARDIIQHPGELCRGEIGIGQQAGAFRQQRLMPLGAEFCAGIRGAAVLPDNGAMQAAPRSAIPKQRGFALIGNADAGDIGCAAACFLQSLTQACNGALPDILRLMLNPARGGEMLRQFHLRGRAWRQIRPEGDGARRGRALIERKQQRGLHAVAFPSRV